MDPGKDIDFILTNFVGGRGLWQWLVIFALWPINFAALNALVLHMFTAYAPRHRYDSKCHLRFFFQHSTLSNTIFEAYERS